MYIRLVTFQAAPGKKSEVAAIADQFIPHIKAKPGNRSCHFLMDDEAGEYGMVIFWDTKENADAAKAAIGPQLIPMLEAMASGPVKITLYEAYGS
jgi:quinol monooxygenase YgiN